MRSSGIIKPPLIPGSANFNSITTHSLKTSIFVDKSGNSYYTLDLWKGYVVAATVSNIVLNGVQVVDGFLLSINNLVLVKNQLIGSENGIYVVKLGTWIRNDKMSIGTNASGSGVFVLNGSTNNNKIFVCTNQNGFDIVGINTLTFAINTATATPSGSNGQYQINNGGVFSGVTMSGDATINISGVVLLSSSGVSPGTYTSANITVDSKGRVTSATNGSGFSLTNGYIYIGNTSNVPTARLVTGDASLSDIGVLSLSNSGVAPGTYTSTNLTIDSKGRITSASNGSNIPSLANGNIFVGSASNVATSTTMTGDAIIMSSGSLSLVNTAVVPGSYVNTNITVDSKGRITAASSATQLSMGVGSPTEPSYTFNGNFNTGIYSSASDTINITTGGTSKLQIDTIIDSSAPVRISNTTASTNTTTGALVVFGSVGVEGSMNVGDSITVQGSLLPTITANGGSVYTITRSGFYYLKGSFSTNSYETIFRFPQLCGNNVLMNLTIGTSDSTTFIGNVFMYNDTNTSLTKTNISSAGTDCISSSLDGSYNTILLMDPGVYKSYFLTMTVSIFQI